MDLGAAGAVGCVRYPPAVRRETHVPFDETAFEKRPRLAKERARDIVLEMRENSAAADGVLEPGQSLIPEFTPGWLTVFFHDGRHEVDNAAAFREAATREIEVMYEGLEKHGGTPTKVSVKAAKSGRLDFLKRVFVP